MAQKYTFQQLQDLWIQAGGPANVAPAMAAIAGAESSFGTNLQGDYGYTSDGGPTSFGLWQIHTRDTHGYVNTNNGVPYNEQSLVYDPLYNAKAAVNVWKSQGLGAWSTWTSGTAKSILQSFGIDPVTYVNSGKGSLILPANPPISGDTKAGQNPNSPPLASDPSNPDYGFDPMGIKAAFGSAEMFASTMIKRGFYVIIALGVVFAGALWLHAEMGKPELPQLPQLPGGSTGETAAKAAPLEDAAILA